MQYHLLMKNPHKIGILLVGYFFNVTKIIPLLIPKLESCIVAHAGSSPHPGPLHLFWPHWTLCSQSSPRLIPSPWRLGFSSNDTSSERPPMTIQWKRLSFPKYPFIHFLIHCHPSFDCKLQMSRIWCLACIWHSVEKGEKERGGGEGMEGGRGRRAEGKGGEGEYQCENPSGILLE